MHNVGKYTRVATVLVPLFLIMGACGSDSDGSSSTAAVGDAPTQNACPSDGCQVTIGDVVSDGGELLVTFEANFLPDISNNHIHIYWDTYDAAQVSNDAEANGLEQGAWVPTDAFPTFVTTDAVSVGSADASDTLCVTVGDRDHNVPDPDAIDCRDVSDLIS